MTRMMKSLDKELTAYLEFYATLYPKPMLGSYPQVAGVAKYRKK